MGGGRQAAGAERPLSRYATATAQGVEHLGSQIRHREAGEVAREARRRGRSGLTCHQFGCEHDHSVRYRVWVPKDSFGGKTLHVNA